MAQEENTKASSSATLQFKPVTTNEVTSLKFEWDPEKAASTNESRGITFEYAARVFLDAHRKEAVDCRKDYGEVRIIVIGCIDERVFVVVYTMRGDTKRLISARKASKREANKYSELRSGCEQSTDDDSRGST